MLVQILDLIFRISLQIDELQSANDASNYSLADEITRQLQGQIEQLNMRIRENQNTVQALRKNLETELIEKKGKETLLKLRGDLIYALQSKDKANTKKMHDLENKLSRACRSVS